jgi:hypothetical protein
MNHPDQLIEALKELDTWLQYNNITLELKIIGSFALYLSGLTHIRTKDIDTVQDLDDQVIDQVNRIASTRGLIPLWLNDDSASLPKPKGFETRLIEKKIGNHLVLHIASRLDLIQLKAAAYIDRGNENPKDLTDLKALAPSQDEILTAIQFVRETRTPEKAKFYPNFEEMIGHPPCHQIISFF